MKICFDFYELMEIKISGKLKQLFEAAKQQDKLNILQNCILKGINKDVVSINQLKEFVENNYDKIKNQVGLQTKDQTDNSNISKKETVLRQYDDIVESVIIKINNILND